MLYCLPWDAMKYYIPVFFFLYKTSDNNLIFVSTPIKLISFFRSIILFKSQRYTERKARSSLKIIACLHLLKYMLTEVCVCKTEVAWSESINHFTWFGTEYSKTTCRFPLCVSLCLAWTQVASRILNRIKYDNWKAA